jgi:NAD+ synthase (glutamine-hydrolysing)
MRIIAAQINPTIGDLKRNTEKILHAIEIARQDQADLVLFPELALCGYPPEDFLLLPHFIDAVAKHLDIIVKATKGIAAVVGLPRETKSVSGKRLHNSAALIHDGQLEGYADKILLPTYDVFDERRYFEPGTSAAIWNLNEWTIGVTICEDAWQHSGLLQMMTYARDPIQELHQHRLTCMINLSASPYSLNKFPKRMEVFCKTARSLECPVIMCNQVGGNDSLIFDGYSLYADKEGIKKISRGFKEDFLSVDLDKPSQPLLLSQSPIADLYDALVLGIRDYFNKLGFKKACLGLSGGIDSAVVACLATAALDKSHILAIEMPSRYTSPDSITDATLLAERLGIDYQMLSIEEPFKSYLALLAPSFVDQPADTTEENLQARIRGMLLMAFSNKFGYLVLSTGNKSELAMGYSTLYGDMCGGLAVLGDLTKQQVYALAEWINRRGELIPRRTIERAPSAELRPNQKDSDTLPDYAIIDQVLQAYVEEHQSPEEIAEKYHYPLSLVKDLVKRIHDNEYKRRQSPPSLRVSEKAFSVGRRFPIVQGWVKKE